MYVNCNLICFLVDTKFEIVIARRFNAIFLAKIWNISTNFVSVSSYDCFIKIALELFVCHGFSLGNIKIENYFDG